MINQKARLRFSMHGLEAGSEWDDTASLIQQVLHGMTCFSKIYATVKLLPFTRSNTETSSIHTVNSLRSLSSPSIAGLFFSDICSVELFGSSMIPSPPFSVAFFFVLGPLRSRVLQRDALPADTLRSSMRMTIKAAVTKIQYTQYDTTEPIVAEFCQPRIALKMPHPPFEVSSGLQQLTCLYPSAAYVGHGLPDRNSNVISSWAVAQFVGVAAYNLGPLVRLESPHGPRK
jgi:hypothetical protein